ncbi:MAG TPA: DMT family transporter [Candidatus Sulfotelmatobacter sp.]|nr:DMT family transporter [Candidatus Sulfotelmatobacter sp.]
MIRGPVPAWLLLSLGSLVLVGTADLLFRRATLRRFAPASFMVMQSWFFGPTALAFAAATGNIRWTPAILWGLVAGVLSFVATYSFLRSLQAPGGQVTVNAPIYRLNLVVAAILAILFLGERLTWHKAAGLLLAAGAVLLLSEFSFRRLGARPGGVGWAFLAMAAFGLLLFVYKIGVMLGAPPPLLIFGQFCALTTIALCYATWVEGGLRLTRTIWAHAPICGVLNSSGRVLLAWALQSGEASATVPVSQMSFVFTFLLAAPLFGEPITRRKAAGLLAAVLAILAFYR